MNSTCKSVCACRAAAGPGLGDTLVVSSGTSHTLSAIASLARAEGHLARIDGNVARITGPDLPTFVAAAVATLTSTEAAEARAAFISGDLDADASLAAGLAAVSLVTLAARHQHADVAELVEDELSFWSAYQPIVELATGDVVAHEALLRADAEDGSPVFPDRLFGAAEAAGWTHVLDRIGRETAIRNAGPWLGDATLFVNFIPTSIYRPELCLRTTEAASRDAGIPLDQIVFEVVESHRLDDVGHLERIFAHYRERGCRVALDDIGSGYSSLNLMARLQPDIVKLDMELVHGLPDPGYRAIVRAITDMAHGFDATVVAEGLETEQQRDEVMALGVDLGQGWLLGRPERKTPRREPATASS